MMNQKEGVFAATVSVLNEKGIELTGPIMSHPRYNEVKAVLLVVLCAAFRAKEISLDVTYDDEGLKKYTRGLINNWHRKDIRYNGGKPYEIKNPGSRAHVGNEALRELKKFRVQQVQANAEQSTLDAIDEMIALKTTESKVKEVKVDISKIDADFLKRIGYKI